MRRKIDVSIVLFLMVFFIPASLAWGQFIPNAPFKPQNLTAPDFSLKDINGKAFRLSAQRGKPVLIFFGTTWCPGCRTEIPVYKKVYETYAPRGLNVIYVNIMESANKVSRFAKTHSLPYRTLLDEDGEVANAYNVVGVPMILLVDKKGFIVKVGHSSSEMPLERILNEK